MAIQIEDITPSAHEATDYKLVRRGADPYTIELVADTITVGWGEITGLLSDQADLQAALDDKSPTNHTHVIAGVDGLQATLDGKAATVHSHAISDVTGLQTALDDKAALVHTHDQSDITGLAAVAVSGNASDVAVDDSGFSNLTGTDAQALFADIDSQIGAIGSAWGSITGTLSDQTDLQTALDAKAAIAGQAFTGAISATNLSGTNTGDQTITLTGEVTGSGTGSFATTLLNSAVIGKVLTGFTSGAGTVGAADTVLGAIQKLDGNVATKVTGPASSTDNALARFDLATGKLIQNSAVTLDDNGGMTFPAIATPTTPAASHISLFGRDFGGRILPAIIGPSGVGTSLQPFLASNSVAVVWARGSTSNAFDAVGAGITATGAATAAAMAATNYHTRVRRVEWLVTTPSTSAVAGFRGNSGVSWTVGGDVAGVGGFHFVCRWSGATGMTNGSHRGFVGLRNTASAPTDVNPSTLADIVGMGWDASDTFIQIMHNDASGTATRVPTSLAKPSVDRTDYYELSLFSPPGTTQIVHWRIANLATGAEATGSVNSDLPSTTTFLNLFGQISVGGVSSVVGMSFRSLYIETDN